MKGYFSGALAFGVLSAAAVLACAALSLRLRHRAEESDARCHGASWCGDRRRFSG